MHRLLVDEEALKCDSPMLSKEAANHLKVVRPKDGEEIELFDGKGSWRVYKVGVGSGSGSGSGRAVFSLTSTSQPLNISTSKPLPLTLFACVTKGSRWDWTIEKATELGVTRIVPVVSERTIVRIPKAERAAKRERWLRIAEEAARQSDAKWLPEILEPLDFDEALEFVKATRCFIGALTSPPPRMILDELARGVARDTMDDRPGHAGYCTPSDSRGLAIFVGPEGDFTPTELDSLIAIATPVSFGPTVLRAETAAIFGLSVLAAYQQTERPRIEV